jgi:hypothetical protein
MQVEMDSTARATAAPVIAVTIKIPVRPIKTLATAWAVVITIMMVAIPIVATAVIAVTQMETDTSVTDADLSARRCGQRQASQHYQPSGPAAAALKATEHPIDTSKTKRLIR